MQAGPYDNIPIDNGRATSHLNANPNSLYYPRPATTGYTATPSQPVQYPHQVPSPLVPAVEHKRNSKRATTHWSKLKASSGLVFASQLQPEQSPLGQNEFPKLRTADRVRNIACPISEGTFVTPYQLQAHFPACVKRNGNPEGLFWDETLPPKWRKYGKGDTIRSDNLNTKDEDEIKRWKLVPRSACVQYDQDSASINCKWQESADEPVEFSDAVTKDPNVTDCTIEALAADNNGHRLLLVTMVTMKEGIESKIELWGKRFVGDDGYTRLTKDEKSYV